MKSVCIMVSVALMSVTTVAFAQHDAHKAAEQVAPPEAQKSFDDDEKPGGRLGRPGDR